MRILDRIEKFKGLKLKKADAAADIDLINQFSVKQLRPEDVYCFSVVLCDNDADRDMERFPTATLRALAPMFIGKPGIRDHRWSADKQFARLYRTAVENGEGVTKTGEQLRVLRGSAYMLKNEANQPIIDAIDGGILKEISVGCSVGKCCCSICGEPQKLDWKSWKYQCKNEHVRGTECEVKTKDGEYETKLCVGDLLDPKDAYEFSFVTVPAQKRAGVTKSANTLDEAFESLMTEDLSSHAEKIKQLMPRLQTALMDEAERVEREKIRKYAEQFIRKN